MTELSNSWLKLLGSLLFELSASFLIVGTSCCTYMLFRSTLSLVVLKHVSERHNKAP